MNISKESVRRRRSMKAPPPPQRGYVSITRKIHKNPRDLYEVIEVLGEGAYGTIYKVKSRADEKVYAAKVCKFDPNEIEEVEKEILIIRSCSHKNIIKTYDSFKFENKIWILLDCCEGGSVMDVIGVIERNLKEDEMGLILYNLVDALHHLHKMSKIHRDIKAANVLLTREGLVKLTDFGTTVEVNSSSGKRNSVIGSPYWMAPEVIKKEQYDSKADIWSLGITIIEMAQGKPPLEECNPLRAFFLIPKNPPPTFREPEKWSPELVDLVAQCTRKNPNQRPSASQLLCHPFFLRKVVTHKREMKENLKALMDELFGIFNKHGGKQGYFKYQEELALKKFEEEKIRGFRGRDEEFNSDWEESSDSDDDDDDDDSDFWNSSGSDNDDKSNEGKEDDSSIKNNIKDEGGGIKNVKKHTVGPVNSAISHPKGNIPRTSRLRDGDNETEPPPKKTNLESGPSERELQQLKQKQMRKIKNAFTELYFDISDRTEHLYEIEKILVEKEVNRGEFKKKRREEKKKFKEEESFYEIDNETDERKCVLM